MSIRQKESKDDLMLSYVESLERRDKMQKIDELSGKFAVELTTDPKLTTVYEEGGKPVYFVAGGALPQEFGLSESEVWKKMAAHAKENQGVFETAGIKFDIDALALMGEFYRLRMKNTQCIDERLSECENFAGVGIHCKCGACAAVQGTLSQEDSLEDEMKAKLSISEKQPLLDGTEGEHVSRMVMVTMGSPRALTQEAKLKALDNFGLPFNASLPVKQIFEFAQEKGLSANQLKDLIKVLVLWNVQIAQNIMAGDHNELQDLAKDGSLVLLDETEEEYTHADIDIKAVLLAEIKKVIPDKNNRWITFKN